MKKITAVLFTALSVLVLSCNNNKGDTYTLRPNLKTGESYELTYKIDMDQDVMGMNNKMHMNMGYQLKVKDVTAQRDIVMDFMYKHLGMDMKSAMFNLSYDSDSAVDNSAAGAIEDIKDPASLKNSMSKIFGKSIGAMIGKNMEVTLDSSGKVKDVKGYRELMQSLKDSMATISPGSTDALDNIVSEDQITQIFQQTFGTFPTKPVTLGEKWTNEFSLSQTGMPMKYTSTYKLLEVFPKDNEAIIDVSSIISTGKGGEIKKNNMTMKIDMNGTQTGKLTVDLNTGLVKTGKLNMDVKMTMEAMGQKIPMTMKGTATLAGKKL